MASIALSGVSKVFPDGTAAVDDLDLDIPDGGFTVLVGPSGSGKSTALRMVAGLEDTTAGTIRIGERVVNDVAPKDRDVAMVFQSYALYPHMTVFENIAVALQLRRVARDEVRRRVEEAAARLGIEAHLPRRPRELSGGERQRVALARAIVRRPRLFLLDEPLSNLDAQLRERARAELKALFSQLKATVVYVTHDQVEAMTLSDRIAVMNAGVLEQLAPPQEVYDRPATLFVAGFVGSPRMNLMTRDGATTGIRPEDVVIGEGPIEGEVTLREPIGGQHVITLNTPDGELRALVPADWRGGPKTRLALPPGRLHRFDASGARVSN
jgi:ABC-type sugar transport system ATPase subunit